jgi:transcriptional regulator with PAS, ATPase and Fis domain
MLGMFELADQGTLFLDEIGELEPRIQVKLLRVLDGAPYYRLGGSRKVAFDVRIVAATN